MGYVHFERVGPRTFTCTYTCTPDTGSSSSFFCTFDSSLRFDRGRRVGPGVRTLTLTVSAIWATSPFFSLFCVPQYYCSYYILSVLVWCSFSSPLSFLSFSSVRFSICDTLMLSNRWPFKNQALGCQLANSSRRRAVLYDKIRAREGRYAPLVPCNGGAGHPVTRNRGSKPDRYGRWTLLIMLTGTYCT